MPAQPFEAAVRQQTGAVVIDLRGEINASAESALNAAYLEAERSNPSTIVLNFGAVSYINSTGIALIVGLLTGRARPNAVCSSLVSAATTRRFSKSHAWPILWPSSKMKPAPWPAAPKIRGTQEVP